ncbi:carboxymuconolactone decarboxylase family protein [Jiella pacifica]|uniref:Carboxymuconolactone decarboxylase family protein n=1 Tax=Jiella pacifica TaxID=2696469 RepID=A0A6N9T5U1_9HYPH|nr:carboxymuconolactone decarboxylase family protein [Jiella pacifica]NDW05942.1 carboxymuconolactone decarboxylase family protein [Jiella pacifica]
MAKRPIDLDENALTPEQQVVFNAIASGPRGVVEGPLRVWLQSPALAETAQALGAFCRYGTRLPPKLSELAILVTGAFWRSGFEWAVHAPIAIREGLSTAVVEAIRRGEHPDFGEPAEAAIYDFASELHRDHRVRDETYARVTALFGQEGAVELTGILGYYTLISMTINAFEVPLPEGATDPFPAEN